MEKSINKSARLKKIAIIGPECAGKTTLAHDLAQHFSTVWVPEYARGYVEGLNRPYTYSDVEAIAKMQLSQINQSYPEAKEFVFFDTELIITKVWFNLVYHKIPEWIDNAIQNSHFDLYLLCNTDILWVPDKVRENGGANRENLYQIYLKEIQSYHFRYEIISGLNTARFNSAIKTMSSIF